MIIGLGKVDDIQYLTQNVERYVEFKQLNLFHIFIRKAWFDDLLILPMSKF